MRTSFKTFCVCLILYSLFCSCGTYFNQPVATQSARLGESTEQSKRLAALPPPINKIDAAVYRFTDQSGQYKPTELGQTFSTAVTQGGTSILLKAMEDSGWFTTIERENFNNLRNERALIRSSRQNYQAINPNAQLPPPLDPLLYAGIILEGGIVSYDANQITGGFGARYFGVGGSTQYRQDRVTVYLRAVSTQSGEILKTVYTSKTILSQGLDGGFFRYVKLRRLLEVETGFTYNEPSHLAVTEAIEKAVEAMVIEGIVDGLWPARGTEAEIQKIVTDYNQEKEIAADTKIFNRLFQEQRTPKALRLVGGGSLYDGDFGGSELKPRVEFGFDHAISNSFRLTETIGISQIAASQTFSSDFNDISIDGKYILLPYEELSPYAIGGLGYYLENDGFSFNFSERSFFKARYGVGLEYITNEKLSIVGDVSHNLVFSDDLEGIPPAGPGLPAPGISGERDDQYFGVAVGVNFYLGKSKGELNTSKPIGGPQN